MMRIKRFFSYFSIALVLYAALGANIYAASSPVDNAQLEARLKTLSNELRCLVCQNSTLADSNAPLADDLRNEIRKLMLEGKTDEEVKAYLVERYGDFVLYRPPLQANTALLWIGPFVMLLIGAVAMFFVLKKRSRVESESKEN